MGLTLTLHAELLAVCELPPDAAVPDWVAGGFTSVTRTPHEVSVICPQGRVPPAVASEGGWRALEVAGPLDFALTGILASLAVPLADAGIPILAVATFGTDWLLVRASDLEPAIATLQQAGHRIEPA